MAPAPRPRRAGARRGRVLTVAVLTDSAASLPEDLADRAGVRVVPMWLTLGGRAVRDGDLTLGEVIAATEHGDFTTSGPSPGEFAEEVDRADTGEGAVVVTVAREMSGTHQAARLAAGVARGRVRVVDSRTAAGAQGLVALAGARCASSGGTLDEVEAAARRAAERVRFVAALESVERLARGGRVPAVAARAGRALGVHPLFAFEEGRARPLRPALSRAGARQRLLAACAGEATAGGRLHLAVVHALERSGADALLDEIRTRVRPATAWIGSFSPVMAAHTGPGLLGVAWWREAAEHGRSAGDATGR